MTWECDRKTVRLTRSLLERHAPLKMSDLVICPTMKNIIIWTFPKQICLSEAFIKKEKFCLLPNTGGGSWFGRHRSDGRLLATT